MQHTRIKSVCMVKLVMLVSCAGLLCLPAQASETNTPPRPYRLFVVSSYHREYLWSQDTQKGVCAGLLEFGFLDNKSQADEFTAKDAVSSAHAVVRKTWMDTKRKHTRPEIAATVVNVVNEIHDFAPDLILLGDDNAANFIGNQFVDSSVAVVFWGVDGLPLKYGLLDSLEKPGHNVTGVYQAGYPAESLAFLTRVVPGIKTFAVLSDDSETGRSKAKDLRELQRKGGLAAELKTVVITDSYADWRAQALRLQKQVDAFFVVNHNSLRDDAGRCVDQLEAGHWYLRNIRIPECGEEKQFVQEGMLCVCDDSGFNQGYEAVKLAHRILHLHESPAAITVTAPRRGPFIVNRERASMLGLTLTPAMGVEAYEDKALALEPVEPGSAKAGSVAGAEKGVPAP